MSKFALITAAVLSAAAFGAAAIAQESNDRFDQVDANNDNVVSWDEARGLYPTLSEDLFVKADADGDGVLDMGEFTSLQGLTAGLGDTIASSVESSSEESSSEESSAESSAM